MEKSIWGRLLCLHNQIGEQIESYRTEKAGSIPSARDDQEVEQVNCGRANRPTPTQLLYPSFKDYSRWNLHCWRVRRPKAGHQPPCLHPNILAWTRSLCLQGTWWCFQFWTSTNSNLFKAIGIREFKHIMGRSLRLWLIAINNDELEEIGETDRRHIW